MCGYNWTTALKCEYCPKMLPWNKLDEIEGDQPNCHFTMNEGNGVDAASLRLFFEPQATKKQNKPWLQTYYMYKKKFIVLNVV
jgi:hypothetical protein